MTDFSPWLPLFFFGIAFFYSLVGFGGGSAYLTVLVLAGFSHQSIPPLALVCNLIVALSGFLNFYQAGYFRPRQVFPFVLSSIPMAYWGGTIQIGKQAFSVLLGFALLAVAVRMLMPEKSPADTKEISWKDALAVGLPAGGLFGLFSGLVGIGGGVFLSPFLLTMRWADSKQAAASASLFITVNSLAGLAGHLQKGYLDLGLLFPLGLAVFLGGQTGSRFSVRRLPQTALVRILSGLVLFVSLRLFMRAL